MRRCLQSLGRMLFRSQAQPKLAENTVTAADSLLASTIQAPPLSKSKSTKVEETKTLEPKTLAKIPTPPETIKATPPEPKESASKQNQHVYQSTFDQLFRTLARNAYKANNKVTVVGAGDVGMSTVFSLLTRGITNDVSFIDFNEEKLKGELMDLQYGSKFLPDVKLRAGKDYAISVDSRICVLAPCADIPTDEENSADINHINLEVLKAIIPQLLKYSPDTIFLVAIDPVDVFSYLTWRLSGLSKSRVLGTGTNLYTASFQYLLANRMGLAPSTCHGYIIGENGFSCVPVWSGVTVGGVHLQHMNPLVGTEKDPENWAELHRQVLLGEIELKHNKGGNCWASALSICDICSSILYDANTIRPVSTYVKGEYNINDEVFLSTPCVVGGAGITDIIRLPLSSLELTKLQRSADIIKLDQDKMKIIQ